MKLADWWYRHNDDPEADCPKCDKQCVHHRWGPLEVQHHGTIQLGRRWMYWSPRSVTRFWWFKVWKGGDEDCNSSICLKLPFLGALIFFYEWPYRPPYSGMCESCRDLLREDHPLGKGWTEEEIDAWDAEQVAFRREMDAQ